MNDKLFIPEKINVGYQERSGTYTGKLAYIIYWDEKGKLRKETSWNGWRDENIPNDEIENVPTEGFVLNKGVGGARQSYGWNARNEYIRVYDPRDFEFEISVANLLFILQETNSIVGKGLEGEFVYSWSGTELVLLPANSQEYKSSKESTELQGKKVTKADMEVGCGYKTKKGQNLVYLGRYDFYTVEGKSHYSNGCNIQSNKRHVFYNQDYDPELGNGRHGYKRVWSKTDRINDEFIGLTGFVKLAEKTTAEPVGNYAELMDMFNESTFASKPVGIKTEPKILNIIERKKGEVYNGKEDSNYPWNIGVEYESFVEYSDGEVCKRQIEEDWDYEKPYNYRYAHNQDRGSVIFKGYKFRERDSMKMKNGTLKLKDKWSDTKYITFPSLQELKFVQPSVVLENGREIMINQIDI